MRYFSRLPPVLRVASILGLLFAFTSIVLVISVLGTALPSFPQSPPDFGRLLIGLNFGMLGGTCSLAVTTYSARFRRPDRWPYPLRSWQSQLRALGLLAALPTCSLAFELVASVQRSAWLQVLAVAIFTLAAFVFVVASLALHAG